MNQNKKLLENREVQTDYLEILMKEIRTIRKKDRKFH